MIASPSVHVIGDDFDPTPEDRFMVWATSFGNVFLTGQAGTGKSTLLREFLSRVEGVRDVAITAPTGIAALNVGGTTVHRWCGMQLGPQDGEDFLQAAERLESHPAVHGARKRVRATEVLVVDEISMMAGRHLDFLNYWVKRIREDSRPFGGLQVIFLGDFLQLPPVRTDQSKPYDWAFLSKAWEEAEKLAYRTGRRWKGSVHYDVDRGHAMRLRGRTEEAVRLFEGLINQCSGEPNQIMILAGAFRVRSENEWAEKTYRRGRVMAGNPAAFAMELADLAYGSGQKAAMIEHYLDYLYRIVHNPYYLYFHTLP